MYIIGRAFYFRLYYQLIGSSFQPQDCITYVALMLSICTGTSFNAWRLWSMIHRSNENHCIYIGNIRYIYIILSLNLLSHYQPLSWYVLWTYVLFSSSVDRTFAAAAQLIRFAHQRMAALALTSRANAYPPSSRWVP